MKNTLQAISVLFVLVGAASAQSSGGSVGSPPVSSTFEISSHQERATYKPLDTNLDILVPSSEISASGSSSGMGEWVKQPAPEPLGTMARRNREHALEYTNGKHVSTVTP